jgi:IS1 family transposase
LLLPAKSRKKELFGSVLICLFVLLIYLLPSISGGMEAVIGRNVLERLGGAVAASELVVVGEIEHHVPFLLEVLNGTQVIGTERSSDESSHSRFAHSIPQELPSTIRCLNNTGLENLSAFDSNLVKLHTWSDTRHSFASGVRLRSLSVFLSTNEGTRNGKDIFGGGQSGVLVGNQSLWNLASLETHNLNVLNVDVGSLRSRQSALTIFSRVVHFVPLSGNEYSSQGRHEDGDFRPSYRRLLKSSHLLLDFFELFGGGWLCCLGVPALGYLDRRQFRGWLALFGGGFLIIHGGLRLLYVDKIVTQKLLTTPDYCNTVIAIGRAHMANVLSTDKQIAIIGALAEGSSIRSIERITGVHRDTIMRLGVRTGKGCARLLGAKMRNLPCKQLQFDEIWGFIGKKERHCTPDDSMELGDVWTFCAIDAETKIVPSFKCGKRDLPTANAFVADVASRLRNRVQISSDALRAYVDAVEMNFGADVDFAQIIKTYVTDDSHIPERRFSAPEIVITEKKTVSGFPDLRLASTSHVERLNGTTRLHMRRLTRLTYAFSKKLENFEAAVALHFAYYNFVKRHITLRATPAMAAGIERDFWTVGDLLEAA